MSEENTAEEDATIATERTHSEPLDNSVRVEVGISINTGRSESEVNTGSHPLAQASGETEDQEIQNETLIERETETETINPPDAMAMRDDNVNSGIDVGRTENSGLSPPAGGAGERFPAPVPPIIPQAGGTAPPPRIAPFVTFGSPPPASVSSTPSRTGCLSRLEPIISILMYPIMVLITFIMLIMVITFCIIPTLCLMTLGICLYYCLREDPIPLSVLLRYMLSPDPEESDYPSSYALAQRPVIASKLIVRRLQRIDDVDPTDEASKQNQEYPRRHPSSIKVFTDHKCLEFSEPVTIEEDENNNESNDNSGDAVPRYHRAGDSAQSVSNEEVADGVITNDVDNDNDNNNNEAIYVAGDVELGVMTNSPGDEDGGDLQDHGVDNPIDGEVSTQEGGGKIGVYLGSTTVCPPARRGSNSDQLDSSGAGSDYFGIHTEARDRGTTCDICLLEFRVGEAVAWSPNTECIHAFHRDCILDWLVRKPTCPNCRVDYLKGKHDGDV